MRMDKRSRWKKTKNKRIANRMNIQQIQTRFLITISWHRNFYVCQGLCQDRAVGLIPFLLILVSRDCCLHIAFVNCYTSSSCLARSRSAFLPNFFPKNPSKLSKRSSSSKTSQRKSIPRDDENISISDANEPENLSIYGSIKMRYFEESDTEEDNEDIGRFGLELESSNNQVKYKHLGKFAFLKHQIEPQTMNVLFRFA